MGEKFSTTIETFISNSINTTLSMDNKHTDKISSSNTSNLEESSILHTRMLNNLLEQKEMVKKLRIKKKKIMI